MTWSTPKTTTRTGSGTRIYSPYPPQHQGDLLTFYAPQRIREVLELRLGDVDRQLTLHAASDLQIASTVKPL